MNKWLDSTIKNYIHYFGKTEKPVVWDVGSRDGHDGVELAKRIYEGEDDWFWTNAKVVCVEPNLDQVAVIKDNYPNAVVHECAVSNQNRMADFIVYEGNEGDVGSSSLNLRWKGDDLKGNIVQVPTRRLDDLIEDEIIDIMKIDVEGHSVETIGGFEQKINRVRVIHIETETWTGSDKFIEKLMKHKNWTLVDVQEQYGDMPDQVWVNTPLLRDLEE